VHVRLAVVLAGCAACGRLGFDSQAALGSGSGSADAGHDASGDAPDAAAGKLVFVITAGPNAGDPTDLITLDLTNGHVALFGQINSTLGQLGGLAYWDANTLYATGSGNIVQITLSPFSATQVATSTYTMSALERDGTDLIGLEQGTNVLVRFQPPYTNPTALGTGLDIDGGDLVQTTTGTWFYYSNATTSLFTLDVMSGAANQIGSPSSPGGFVSALTRDDSDQLFITVEGTDTLIPVDSTTGALGAAITLCEICPTPYPLGAGDATRTP
jgi:hypothetical protein